MDQMIITKRNFKRLDSIYDHLKNMEHWIDNFGMSGQITCALDDLEDILSTLAIAIDEDR